ncbi:choice-of-anchor D domain-containing protein [Hymenobacter sp. BT18]|uniref:choice-of-anchor D domain-containing protein n=1 Tax=Hymenobacter sp. BT18 TaxID=2835648 RepID=UPI001E38F4EE|nr:choice-of-anchor D domain-containing protein [Hymenobacter sp. BT18]
MLADGATAPTAAQVKAAGGTPLASGNFINPTANTAATTVVGGLSASTAYDVYVVAEDNVPNLQASPVKLDVTTGSGAATPAITVSAAALTAFNTVASSPSAEQSFTVSATNLTANVAVQAPTGYEVSQSSGSGFGSSTSIAFGSGTLTSVPVYVRLSGAGSGTVAGNVTLNSTGAAEQTKAVTGTVVAEPTTAPTVSAGTPTQVAVTLTVGSGNGAKRLLVVRAATTTAVAPTDKTAYTANLAFGSGATTGTGNFVVLNGTGTSAAVTGLTAGTNYVAEVYAYNESSTAGFENYLQTPLGSTTFTTTALPPNLVASPTSLTGFATSVGVVSAEQSYTLTPTNLSAPITVSVPVNSNYEVSLTSGSGFSNTVEAPQTGASTIYVRIKAAATATNGDVMETLTNVSGAKSASVTVTGSVLPAGYSSCLSQGFDTTPFPPTGWLATGVTRTTSSTYNGSAGAAEFNSNNGTLTTPELNYPASVSFYLTRTTNATPKTFEVKVSTTGQNGTYAVATGGTFTLDNTSTSYIKYTVDLSAYSTEAQVWIRFEKTSATTSPWRLDNVAVICAPTPVPGTVNVTTNGPLAVGTTIQNTPSATYATYSVSGTSLGNIPLKVQAPAGFQVSDDVAFTNVTADANSISLVPVGGTVNPTPIYVRLSGSGTVGLLTGNVVNSSGTSPQQLVAVTGTLNVSPAEINLTDGTTSIVSNNPTPYTFANTPVSTRNTVSFTIENKGGTTLTIGSITSSGGVFSPVGVLPTSIAPFSSATLGVAFTPTATGTFTGAISIVNDDSDENPYVLNVTGTAVTRTFVTWTGLGNDGGFFNPANWSTNTVPGSSSDVLLDHSSVSGAYTVSLGTTPGFTAAAVTLQSLIINPGSGAAIEFEIPASNTLTSALTLQRSTSGETALAIFNNGTFSNKGGGGSAANLEPNGSNETVFIYNGGTYLHGTTASSGVFTENLAGVPGTESGTFIFKSPSVGGNIAYTPALQGRKFGNLTFAVSTNGGYSASGGTPIAVNGNLTIETGTSFANSLAELNLSGNLVINGGFTLNSTAKLVFTGPVQQTISGTELGTTAGTSFLGSSSTLQVNTTASVLLQTPVRINGTLSLLKGNLLTSETNPLTLAPTATVNDASSASFVEGPLKREVAAVVPGTPKSVSFPIGMAAEYRPLTLNISTQTNAAIYTATQHDGAPSNQTLSGGLTRVSKERYFTVTPATEPLAGEFEGTIKLSYEAQEDGVNTPNATSLVIGKSHNGGAWENIGQSETTATTVTSDPFTSFSDFVLASTDASINVNPLPVQLTAFSAAREGAQVQVQWATASERNSARFEVERSADGVHFTQVGRVNGQGSTTARSTYRFADAKPLSGVSYYRLRQVDQDGTAHLSEVRTVQGGKLLAGIYPNPVASTLYLQLPEHAGAVQAIVTDLAGREVYRAMVPASQQLDLRQLPQGSYVLVLQGAQLRSTHKLVKTN